MRQRLPAAERREQLLRSAGTIAQRMGIDALTMERVAAEAGVSKPVVYAHFANADDLAAAVSRREIARLDAEVARRMATAETFDERLDAMVGPYLDAFLAPTSLLRTLALHRPATREGGTGEAGGPQDARIRQVLAFLTEEIARHFGVRRRDAGLAAATLYGGFEAVAAYALVTNADRSDIDRVLRAIVEGGLREVASTAPPRRPRRSSGSEVTVP
jgi:AcrR family transcriptional regulator